MIQYVCACMLLVLHDSRQAAVQGPHPCQPCPRQLVLHHGPVLHYGPGLSRLSRDNPSTRPRASTSNRHAGALVVWGRIHDDIGADPFTGRFAWCVIPHVQELQLQALPVKQLRLCGVVLRRLLHPPCRHDRCAAAVPARHKRTIAGTSEMLSDESR